MSVSGSDPIDVRAQAAAVGQLDRDALGALDDVMIGEDVALFVDDEAGAGAAPRRLAAAADVERILDAFGTRRRAAVVRPRRAARRLLASMLTTAGLSRSATSAKLTTPAMPGIDRAIVARDADGDTTVGADAAGLGDSDPVTTMPTRNDTRGGEPDGEPREPSGHFSNIISLQERRLIERRDAQARALSRVCSQRPPQPPRSWSSC